MMKVTFFFYTNEFIIFAGVTHEKKKVFKWRAAAWGQKDQARARRASPNTTSSAAALHFKTDQARASRGRTRQFKNQNNKTDNNEGEGRAGFSRNQEVSNEASHKVSREVWHELYLNLPQEVEQEVAKALFQEVSLCGGVTLCGEGPSKISRKICIKITQEGCQETYTSFSRIYTRNT